MNDERPLFSLPYIKLFMQQALNRFLCVALLFISYPADILSAEGKTPLQISVKDIDERPLPCRIHLKNERGEPQKALGQPFWHDHFVCSGTVRMNVSPGKYTWEIERGPEYERKSGDIKVVADKVAAVDVTLKRIASLRDEGWYSADLHVHRPVDEIERLILAEDLDFAPVITWWNNKNFWRKNKVPQKITTQLDGHRFYNIMAGEDEREGGALLYFGLKQPLDLSVKSREVPSSMFFAEQAQKKNKDVWIDIEKPFWWDVPVWLASGQMDSIGLANNHMCRSEMLDMEAWGKPRDRRRLGDVRGNGFWTQELYYHILNSGMRIPPSAGSASGVLRNPVGYNRVYAYLGRENSEKESVGQETNEHAEVFTRETWFGSLSRGRCFVTNGPLLRVTANEQLPGATLKLSGDQGTPIKLSVKLTSNDRVPALEVIHNGRVIKTIEYSNEREQQKTIAFTVTESGWFLVRAITDVKNTFRFASTAPWYIESETEPFRGSRQSAQFFLDWVNERIQRIKSNVKDERELRKVLVWQEKAREFWKQKVASSKTLTSENHPE
ncbi:CehA/McbA family metallohydrolase [Gimesia aquarii]|uniref:Uncharacterized protein n=1 Tax=Gimesia aquarii TaxID=2527964 RepID=A0A517VSU0_9PLAN|nr:CehA/McbA family metallohydrolase [Gimesia aquarii]QDT96019.1 hypothetical protein V144x_14720 [Gimesia aquarii]